MPKIRKRTSATAADIEAFAAGADANSNPEPKVEPVSKLKTSTARTTISLPAELLEAVEDMAIANKRGGSGPKSVSAIAQEALRVFISMNS